MVASNDAEFGLDHDARSANADVTLDRDSAATSVDPWMKVEDDTNAVGQGVADHLDTEDTVKPPAGPPSSQASPPPDGGLWAWLQVASGFFVTFNTWGVLNTFGIFQTYYETGALFTETSSNISWIGAIQAYLIVCLGLLSGPLYDRGYLRALVAVGSVLLVFGFMMLSISTTYWQALLAQGFCVGIGGGLIFMPTMAVLPSYFRTRLGLAVGLAASGSSLGGVIYPIIFYRLIDVVGFGWSVRAIGFLLLATQLVPVLFLRMRAPPSNKPREILDWSAFSDGPYVAFTLSGLVGFIGLYVFLFYISFFATATGIASDEMSFYIVPILNAASVLGRIIPNAISDITGPFN
ncbi:hypothetical protein HK405_016032, partial [Cladochytrium tenue]